MILFFFYDYIDPVRAWILGPPTPYWSHVIVCKPMQ